MAARSIALALSLALLGGFLAPTHADDVGRDVYRRTVRATGRIELPGGGMATGWIVDKERKLLITNHHVVMEHPRVNVLFPLFKDGEAVGDIAAYADAPRCWAKIIDYDVALDLAAIQLLDPLPDGMAPLKLAAKSALPADKVHTVGNPGAGDGYFLYTSGTVRQVFQYEWHHLIDNRRYERKARVLRTQAPTNPGDSGGPVVNDKGEIVAVHSSFQDQPRWGRPVQLMATHIDVSDVRPFVERVLQIVDPKTATDHILAGDRYNDREKYDDAVAAYSAALKLEPKNAAAFCGRGSTFFNQGDSDTALADLHRAIELDPDNATAYLVRGQVQYAGGAGDKALADFTKAISLDPMVAVAYNERGNVYYEKEDYKRAIADYNRSLKIAPNDPVVWTNRGDAHYQLGDYDQAIRDCHTALDLNPYQPRAWQYRGWSFLAQKRYDDQVKNFQAALNFTANNPDILVDLGNAHTWKDEWDQAIGSYSLALEADKKHAPAHFQRGNAFEHVGNPHRANTDYQHAVTLDADYKAKLKTFKSFVIKVVNASDDTIRVQMQYEYPTDKGGWAWHPAAVKDAPSWTFKPGEGGKLQEDGWLIHCRRCRIWATATTSDNAWNLYKDKDWLTVPAEGVLSQNRPVILHRFTK